MDGKIEGQNRTNNTQTTNKVLFTHEYSKKTNDQIKKTKIKHLHTLINGVPIYDISNAGLNLDERIYNYKNSLRNALRKGKGNKYQNKYLQNEFQKIFDLSKQNLDNDITREVTSHIKLFEPLYQDISFSELKNKIKDSDYFPLIDFFKNDHVYYETSIENIESMDYPLIEFNISENEYNKIFNFLYDKKEIHYESINEIDNLFSNDIDTGKLIYSASDIIEGISNEIITYKHGLYKDVSDNDMSQEIYFKNLDKSEEPFPLYDMSKTIIEYNDVKLDLNSLMNDSFEHYRNINDYYYKYFSPNNNSYNTSYQVFDGFKWMPHQSFLKKEHLISILSNEIKNNHQMLNKGFYISYKDASDNNFMNDIMLKGVEYIDQSNNISYIFINQDIMSNQEESFSENSILNMIKVFTTYNKENNILYDISYNNGRYTSVKQALIKSLSKYITHFHDNLNDRNYKTEHKKAYFKLTKKSIQNIQTILNNKKPQTNKIKKI